MKLERDGENIRIDCKQYSYCPPPLQLQTFETIPFVFFPSMRNVFVMHSFCELDQAEIGSNSLDISLIEFDIEAIEIEEKTRDRVLTPAQIRYLLLTNNSLSIYRNSYLLLRLHII